MEFDVRVTSMLLENRSRAVTIHVKQGQQVDLVQLFYPSYAGNSGMLRRITCAAGDTGAFQVTGNVVSARQPGGGYVTLNVDEGDDERSESQRFKVIVY